VLLLEFNFCALTAFRVGIGRAGNHGNRHNQAAYDPGQQAKPRTMAI
jgi:hypothetical protein